MKEKISITLNRETLREVDALVDGIAIRNRSQAIETLLEKTLGSRRVAVLLAGGDEKKMFISGEGYRPLVAINDEPLAKLLVERMRHHGFATVYVVARKKLLSRIMAVLGDGSAQGVELHYVEDRGDGSAASVKMLRNRIKSAFIVVPGDNFFDFDIDGFWRSHQKNNCVMTLALTTSSNPASLAVVEVEGSRITRYVDYKHAGKSNLVWSGIFIAEPEFFEYAGKSTETEIVPKIFKDGKLYCYVFSGPWFNMHTKVDVEKAREYFRQ